MDKTRSPHLVLCATQAFCQEIHGHHHTQALPVTWDILPIFQRRGLRPRAMMGPPSCCVAERRGLKSETLLPPSLLRACHGHSLVLCENASDLQFHSFKTLPQCLPLSQLLCHLRVPRRALHCPPRSAQHGSQRSPQSHCGELGVDWVPAHSPSPATHL